MAHSELSLKEKKRESARSQFLSSLDRRLVALQGALDELELGNNSGKRLTTLRRRLQAMAETAAALGLEAIGAAFTSAENVLAGVGSQGLLAMDAIRVRDTLLLVPELVPEEPPVEQSDSCRSESVVTKLPTLSLETEGKISQEVNSRPTLSSVNEHLKQLQSLGELSIVAFCLEDAESNILQFFQNCPAVTVRCYSDSENAVAAVDHYAPDVVLVDGRRADCMVALERFSIVSRCIVTEADPRGTAWSHAEAVSCRGDDLARHILHVVKGRPVKKGVAIQRHEATAPTLVEFAERVSTELKQALLDGQPAEIANRQLELGPDHPAQATVWSAAAKLRGLVREGSSGAIDYPVVGPDGALLAESGGGSLEFGGDERRGRRGTADERNLNGKIVVVADDDPAIAWFLTSILRSKGANVIEARNGREAWDKCVEHVPALVVSDVLMPELDGFALCRNLKRDIVLSDVPVVLLSWKEDLLQRVRELGVGADGYLPKEADASTIVARCCEAIYPRARVEERIQSNEVVYGRLDGITPRLVLHLACCHSSAARVVFHDAAFTYEANVGDGRMLRLVRVSKDGQRESGDEVLPGLLGMRAGRFVVEPTSGFVQADLSGSLSALLQPHIERARQTQTLLHGSRLAGVARIELDPSSISPYLDSSPKVVAKLVEKLAAGTPPSALLKSVSAGLLESVLFDLVQRGAVKSIWNERGEDLLKAPGTEFSLVDIDIQTPEVGLDLVQAPGAPRVSAESTSADVARAVTFADRMASERDAAVNSEPAEPKTQIVSPALQGETSTPPGDTPMAATSSSASDSSFVASRVSDVKAAKTSSSAAVEVATIPGRPADPSESLVVPSETHSEPKTEVSPETADAFRDAAGENKQTAQTPIELGQFLLHELLCLSPSPSVDRREGGLVTEGSVIRASASGTYDQGDNSNNTPTDGVLEMAAVPAEVTKAQTKTEEAFFDGQTEVVTPGGSNPVAFLVEDDAAPIGQEFKLGPSRRVSTLVKASQGPTIAAVLALGGGYAGWTALTSEPTEVFTERLPTEVVESEPINQHSTLLTLLPEGVKPTAASPAPVASARPAKRVDGAQEQLSLKPPGFDQADPQLTRLEITELELPAGVVVAQGRGLIEVVTEAKERLYVDGVFVGRGPIRRIPVRAGAHTVMERSGDEEREYEVRVQDGARLRLGSVPKSGQR